MKRPYSLCTYDNQRYSGSYIRTFSTVERAFAQYDKLTLRQQRDSAVYGPEGKLIMRDGSVWWAYAEAVNGFLPSDTSEWREMVRA